jgi:cytochrome c556
MRSLILAATAVLIAPMAQAQSLEDVANARIGYFRLVSMEMGTLSQMAKGDIPYDADTAKLHAENLAALAQFDVKTLFKEGTSNAELPGKTRAEPAAWEDTAKLEAKGAAFSDAITALVAASDQGEDALKPALAQVGATCKSCHDDYRAKSF